MSIIDCYGLVNRAIGLASLGHLGLPELDDDYDPEADARAGHARRMGHDLPMHERREQALRLAHTAPGRRATTRTG